MALLNPLYACVVPFLLITTIPLAIFAGITTTFAFSILIFRVFVVYLDIALSLVSQSLAHLIESSSGFITSSSKNSHLRPLRTPSSSSSINSRANSVSPSASSTLLKRHRRRRPSSVYSGTATPGSDIGLGLIPSVGAERDFEGVGGWRLGDDDDNDAAWTTINSRSELLHDRSHDRHHRRTLSGGPTSTSAESGFLMMKGRTRSPEKMLLTTPSPNSSRVRAPSAAPRLGSGANNHSDGYFPLMTYSKAVKRNLA